MILKKPYAFLIKHFKMIHVILTGLYIYLAFKVSSILNFYNEYIDGSVGKIKAISYVDNVPFIVIGISFVICFILFILMRYKKKPKLLYFVLSMIYILLYVVLFMSYNGLNTIYNSVLDTKTLLLYRDFLRIIIIFQYISIVFTTIRAIGFDIKKFNFSEDIHTLELDVNDDEEVELVMGVNRHKLTQKFNRFIRETKYYIVENKIFVIVLIIALVVIGGSFITIDKTVINKVYNEGEVFSSDKFNLKIIDSYITSYSYNGSKISEENSYLVLKVYIEPRIVDSSLNASHLRLNIDGEFYKPNLKYYSYFKDLGVGYKEQKLRKGNNYILVYTISNDQIDKSMQILYTASVKDIKVNLSPLLLDGDGKTYEFNMEEGIDFSNSVISGSKFMVKGYEINDKFSYTYDYMIGDSVFEGKKYISSLDGNILYLKIDSSYSINSDDYEFIKEYGVLNYSVLDNIYTSSKLNNKTPGNYKDGIYLEVDSLIKDADKIWFSFNIRNVIYKYNLK